MFRASGIVFTHQGVDWRNSIATFLQDRHLRNVHSPYTENMVTTMATALGEVREAVRLSDLAFGTALSVMVAQADDEDDDAVHDDVGGNGSYGGNVVSKSDRCHGGKTKAYNHVPNEAPAFAYLVAVTKNKPSVVNDLLERHGYYAADAVPTRERNCPNPQCKKYLNKLFPWCAACGWVLVADIWVCTTCHFPQTKFDRLGRGVEKDKQLSCNGASRGCPGILSSECRQGSTLNAEDFGYLRRQILYRNDFLASNIQGKKKQPPTPLVFIDKL
jgi:hypothetical protein